MTVGRVPAEPEGALGRQSIKNPSISGFQPGFVQLPLAAPIIAHRTVAVPTGKAEPTTFVYPAGARCIGKHHEFEISDEQKEGMQNLKKELEDEIQKLIIEKRKEGIEKMKKLLNATQRKKLKDLDGDKATIYNF